MHVYFNIAQKPILYSVWVLDKNRGNPSVRGYLETMDVNELAIEANEKGELEHDTIHDITLNANTYKIKKLSRVNDMVLEVILGKEHKKPLLFPVGSGLGSASSHGEMVKRTIATSDHLGHVEVKSSMPTINGMASVTDVKTLVQETDLDGKPRSVYLQQLTIRNEKNGKTHTTTRYFVPFNGSIGPTALTAGGNNKKERYYDDDDDDEYD